MARRKNAATGAAAARGTALPVPVPGTGTDYDSPAAAIYAALAARPGGATTAIIADAAGIGRPAASDALAAMERAGAVARSKGGKPGVPDIWTSAIGIPHAATGPTARHRADGKHPDGTGPAVRVQVPGSGGRDGPATADPAVITEITRRIEQILAAASAARIALADGGNANAARAGLDEIFEQAAQARRALKAAAGKKAPAARPAALRDKILGHLRNHPGADFSPHEIHNVLGNSPAAIANALDALVRHGQAELASDTPRRFRLASGTPASAKACLADGTSASAPLAGAA